MNAFWLQLLTTAIRALVGSVVWDAALQAVTDLMRADLSGDEKRARVQADLKRAFANVPARLLNLAIEIAVTKTAPK
ncbi:MAG: hypothetical protein RKR03_09170 [Candidatus Competibacter sp.]|nr:hypothetical protein [Candidatus Competibacter sp.]MDS4059838.1 hypothetical protein [Candidatus Contendobacter sp.]